MATSNIGITPKGEQMSSVLIVIPTYNESSLIENSLKNIIDQISAFNLNSEIIVVDDCSTDNTILICDFYATYLLAYRGEKGMLLTK